METREILERIDEVELSDILTDALNEWSLEEILDYCEERNRFAGVTSALEERILEDIKDYINEYSFDVREGKIELNIDAIKNEVISVICQYFFHYNKKTKIDILCDLEENYGLDLGLERFKEELEENEEV